MIRRLRQRHRWMILIIALLCIVCYTVSLIGRTPARRTAIPAALQPVTAAP